MNIMPRVERGIPLPNRAKLKPLRSRVSLFRRMKSGESIFIGGSAKRRRQFVNSAHYALGKGGYVMEEFCIGLRIWKL